MEGCNFIGGCYHNFVIKITIWCAVCRLKKEGVFPVKVTCGHIPLEVSKLCHYFMVHGGLITGAVEDASQDVPQNQAVGRKLSSG